MIDQISFNFDSSHVGCRREWLQRLHLCSGIPAFELCSYQVSLDENASYIHDGLNRSLFIEEPTVNIFAHTVTNGILSESPVSFMRLNGVIGYDNDSNRSYVEVFVDDSLPAKFHYGFGTDGDGLPAMGGEIVVTDGLPVMSWGENDPFGAKHKFLH